jgi:hypothetical protein
MAAGVMLLAARPFSLIWALPNSGFGGDDWRGPVSAFPPFLTRPLRPEGMSKHEFKIGPYLFVRGAPERSNDMSCWRSTRKRVVKFVIELEAKVMKRVNTVRVKAN